MDNPIESSTGCRQFGFTYLILLALIAIMGVMMMAAGQVWHTVQQRDKEQELLFVGNQFRQALNGYYEHSPERAPRYPMQLEDLLKDPRYPSTRRYLRKIYRDPISGSDQWGLVRGADGEIYGIHSLSEEMPIKKGNFTLADKNFEGKEHYADWVFMPIPGQRMGYMQAQ
ncbi:MAG: type II secretion system protein [Sideroxydans sp.]|nr:type II secretion system protein [Sideroxydans sp.]